LNQAAVVRYTGDIFAKDAELSLRRAEVMAQVARSLTAEQKAYFAKMRFGDSTPGPRWTSATSSGRRARQVAVVQRGLHDLRE